MLALAERGASGRDDAGEGRGSQQRHREVATGDPPEHLVDHGAQLGWTRRVGNPGEHSRDVDATLAGFILAGHLGRIGVHPRPEQEEPPEAAGQGVGRGARPHLREGLQTFGT